METAKEICFESWCKNCGIVPPQLKAMPILAELKESEWSENFEQLMRNRLIMGAFRYELFQKKARKKYDYLGSINKRIADYKQTGNTEHLVDAANLLMLEFEFGDHPKKHFNAIDDGEHTKTF